MLYAPLFFDTIAAEVKIMITHQTLFIHDGEKAVQVVTSCKNKTFLESVGFVDHVDKCKPKRQRKTKAKAVADDTSKD